MHCLAHLLLALPSLSCHYSSLCGGLPHIFRVYGSNKCLSSKSNKVYVWRVLSLATSTASIQPTSQPVANDTDTGNCAVHNIIIMKAATNALRCAGCMQLHTIEEKVKFAATKYDKFNNATKSWALCVGVRGDDVERKNICKPKWVRVRVVHNLRCTRATSGIKRFASSLRRMRRRPFWFCAGQVNSSRFCLTLCDLFAFKLALWRHMPIISAKCV